ncbi:MAG: tetratricopeptide repeat protein, partial [Candidatus Hodarchaeota archaeon]
IIKIEVLRFLNKINESFELVEQSHQLLERLTQDQFPENLPEESLQEDHSVLISTRGYMSEIESRKARLLNQKGIFYLHKGKYDLALECFEQGLIIAEKFSNKQEMARSLIRIGAIYYSKGDFDRALDFYQRSLMLTKKFDKENLATSFISMGSVYMRKGSLDLALDYLRRSLSLYRELDDKVNIAKNLNNLGNTYWYKGELDQALDYHQQALLIRKELDNKNELAISFINIGLVYMQKGELNQALEYYQQGLTIFRETGDKINIASSLINIGEIYRQQGVLNKAYEYFQQSMILWKEMGNKGEIGGIFSNIALLYWYKGDLTQATKYLEQSLAIWEEMNHDYNKTNTLFGLIYLTLHKKDLDSTQISAKNNLINQSMTYLSQLEKIHQKETSRLISQRYRLAKALVLKNCKERNKKLEAQQIIQRIIQEEIASYELTILAKLSLCQILFEQLVFTGEQLFLDDLEKLLKDILAISEKEHLHEIMLSTQLLKGKLALLKLNIPYARSIFQQLKVTTQEKGFKEIEYQCEKELTNLQDYITIEVVLKKQEAQQARFQNQQIEDIINYLIKIATKVI